MPVPPKGLIVDLVTPLHPDLSLDEAGLGRLLDRVVSQADAILAGSPDVGEAWNYPALPGGGCWPRWWPQWQAGCRYFWGSPAIPRRKPGTWRWPCTKTAAASVRGLRSSWRTCPCGTTAIEACPSPAAASWRKWTGP